MVRALAETGDERQSRPCGNTMSWRRREEDGKLYVMTVKKVKAALSGVLGDWRWNACSRAPIMGHVQTPVRRLVSPVLRVAGRRLVCQPDLLHIWRRRTDRSSAAAGMECFVRRLRVVVGRVKKVTLPQPSCILLAEHAPQVVVRALCRIYKTDLASMLQSARQDRHERRQQVCVCCMSISFCVCRLSLLLHGFSGYNNT